MTVNCPSCGAELRRATESGIGLTHKQRECFDEIVQHYLIDKTSPTVDELAAALGLKSKSGIVRLVDGLAERGYVRRFAKQRQRNLVITDKGWDLYGGTKAAPAEQRR